MRGRVVLCGAISTYNDRGPPTGPANYRNLIVVRGRMEGFLILDYLDRFPEAQRGHGRLAGRGKHQATPSTSSKVSRHAPEALNLLFTGGNTGKVIVKVDE